LRKLLVERDLVLVGHRAGHRIPRSLDRMGDADRFNSTLSAGGFRGAVRIECGGSTLLDAAYGADGSGTPLTTGTAFQLCSISKSFTAACVLRLVGGELLSLDDPLTSFTDLGPPAWQGMTLHMLLTHTSGLAHWKDTGLDLHEPCPREELIARFAATPLVFRPGEGWAYSSLGYVLLAHVVETVTGEPYPSVLEREVVSPLGLRQTRAEEPAAGVTAAHGSVGGEPVASFDLKLNVGTGDVWSTTGDLVRWPEALASLAPSAVSRHAAVADEENGLTDVGYGYGWFTASLDGERLVFHPGDNAGFVSLLVWAPDHDLVLAMLAADQIDLAPLGLPVLRGLIRG
jgi:CubicO group peptidase (beta-lactamase class C family)